MAELGDAIESALSAVGITDDRVSRWMKQPCGCKARQEKLNNLHRWAKRIAAGKLERAEEYLNNMLGM